MTARLFLLVLLTLCGSDGDPMGMQERQRHVPFGWHSDYGIGQAELHSTLWLAQAMLQHQASVPWAAIQQVVTGVTYGGRLACNADKQALCMIASKLLQSGGKTEDLPGELSAQGLVGCRCVAHALDPMPWKCILPAYS